MSRRRAAEAVWIGALGLGALGVGVAAGLDPIPTTMNDFFLPGSQPGAMEEPFQSSRDACALCHSSGDDSATLPYNRWRASMMGQASRDPIFAACLAVANQDAAFAGDLCLRCHTPQGWIDGHSTPTDGSALVGTDFEGVSCSICHRMVDPVYVSGQSPVEDQGILAALSAIPATPHSGTYIIDPFDRRRGPLNLDQDWPNGFFWHEWRQSPFHLSSALCATCHDVSNPVYTRQADGTYALNALDQAHETQNKYDQFPVERTYSEWSRSLFAQGPVDLDGRFGGARAFVSSCQDCHMPTAAGTACGTFLSPPYRPDVPKHEFAGANTWVLRAVRELYPDAETGLSAQAVDESVARATDMLQRASDMELTRQGGSLNVRVINFSGHKLPTGYAEGRRMWLNVRFYDAANALMAERGGYDPATGYCDYHNTKVYEAIFGVDAAVAALTGIPVGESFHFVVNNVLLFDNRIPPMGFSNTGFAAVQAAPVGYAYADGQYWDDTAFAVPAGARRAEVRLMHQTTTKEYIEFLRDANTTNTAGQTAYDLWVQFGRSPPVEMDLASLVIPCPADFNGNGSIGTSDISAFLQAWFGDLVNGTLTADFNGNGTVGTSDVSAFLSAWFAAISGGC